METKDTIILISIVFILLFFLIFPALCLGILIGIFLGLKLAENPKKVKKWLSKHKLIKN